MTTDTQKYLARLLTAVTLVATLAASGGTGGIVTQTPDRVSTAEGPPCCR